ncbi:hypothetical protein ASPCADRAFT_53414 [Aspergillus carbonarius ITEM 5010]|uniref:Major facilitator superfamily (MFS) profile domain-containing protein n=1 Tax=Aspergillus carbonarius (strain ITEM 5010) TaxID=602072 RepID=A0A1R3RFN5_ASPC5|nr:hypothetical protein ASPCADRAFT_53414 [Aspergillus carbonarius ITEM 5010]
MLDGNQLNWFTTYFNIGIIVGAPFFTPALTVLKPRYLLPSLTMCWSFFVLFMYKAQSAKAIYILRFFAGFFEAGALPGAFYIVHISLFSRFKSWYRKSEIGRRSAIYWFPSIGGSMFSGYIQAGLHANMNGTLGLASWRWVFIFDFILGIPVALFGFFCCPGTMTGLYPHNSCLLEQGLAIQRIADEERDAISFKWDLSAFKRVSTSWQLYTFCLTWGIMELSCGVSLSRWMTLYLKSLKVDGRPKYSIEKINSLPTVMGCVEMVWLLVSSTVADKSQNRAIVIVCLAAVQLFGYIVFLVWSNNDAFMMAVYYLASAYGGIPPLIGAWLNSSCGGDQQLRAISTALMISIGYAVETVAQQEMFPTSQAPRFQGTHGYVFGIVWIAVLIAWCALRLPLVERHFTKRKARSGVSRPSSC